jgi:hypothetical protein
MDLDVGFIARPALAKSYVTCVCAVQLVALFGALLFCLTMHHRRNVLVTVLGVVIDVLTLSVLGWGILMYLTNFVCSFSFLTASLWYCLINQVLLVLLVNAWAARMRAREKALQGALLLPNSAISNLAAGGAGSAEGPGCPGGVAGTGGGQGGYMCTAAPMPLKTTTEYTVDAIESLGAGATTSTGSPLNNHASRSVAATGATHFGHQQALPVAALSANNSGTGGKAGTGERAFFARGNGTGLSNRAAAAAASAAASTAAAAAPSRSSKGKGKRHNGPSQARGENGIELLPTLRPFSHPAFEDQQQQKKQQQQQQQQQLQQAQSQQQPLFVVQRRQPAQSNGTSPGSGGAATATATATGLSSGSTPPAAGGGTATALGVHSSSPSTAVAVAAGADTPDIHGLTPPPAQLEHLQDMELDD